MSSVDDLKTWQTFSSGPPQWHKSRTTNASYPSGKIKMFYLMTFTVESFFFFRRTRKVELLVKYFRRHKMEGDQ